MKPIKGNNINCVAVLYRGVAYIIAPPADHQDVKEYIKHVLNEKTLDQNEMTVGYLTDKDEFVSVDEAIELAKTNNLPTYRTLL